MSFKYSDSFSPKIVTLKENLDDSKILEAENVLLKSRIQELELIISQYEKHRENNKNKELFNYISGLPNRKKLETELSEYFNLIRNEQTKEKSALLLIRLNSNFDVINQVMKPAITEWIIYKTSKTIKKIMGEDVKLYHPRDEEFVLFIENYKTLESIKKLCNIIYTAIKKIHILSEYHISISSRMAIVLAPEHGDCVSTLLSNADIAVNDAHEKKVSVRLYNPDIRKKVVEKIELQSFIMKALEDQALSEINKQFKLHYQPILKIDKSPENNKLFIKNISAETLIRWHHPEKGIIEPQKFIPLAEETGLIIPIGDWVLFTASDQIKEWESHGFNSKISINFSPVQFSRKNVFDVLNNIIEKKKIDPSKINIEITENTLMEDPINSIRKLNKISELGFNISIDDFGTGYSSLGYLKEFPMNFLKIDKSFIKGICTDKYNRSIIRAVMSLASELDFQVIVEGVENIEQFVFLYSEGLRNFQGYFFSKALKPDEFSDFYKNSIGTNVNLCY